MGKIEGTRASEDKEWNIWTEQCLQMHGNTDAANQITEVHTRLSNLKSMIIDVIHHRMLRWRCWWLKDNHSKPVPEFQMIQSCTAARDDGSSVSDNHNCETCTNYWHLAPVGSLPPVYQHRDLYFTGQKTFPSCHPSNTVKITEKKPWRAAVQNLLPFHQQPIM